MRAGVSRRPALDVTNSRSVRRAMIRIDACYHAPKLGATCSCSDDFHSRCSALRCLRPTPLTYPRLRDGFPRRIAPLIPLAESCRMMASSSLDEGASTGDGQLMERGCGARGGHESGTGDVRARSRAASHGEDDGPNVPGSPEKSAHRHYERLPRWMAQGRGVGPGGESPKARRGRDGQMPAVLAVPRYRKRGTRGRKSTPRRAPETAPEKCNLSGAIPAPATPSLAAKDRFAGWANRICGLPTRNHPITPAATRRGKEDVCTCLIHFACHPRRAPKARDQGTR